MGVHMGYTASPPPHLYTFIVNMNKEGRDACAKKATEAV